MGTIYRNIYGVNVTQRMARERPLYFCHDCDACTATRNMIAIDSARLNRLGQCLGQLQAAGGRQHTLHSGLPTQNAKQPGEKTATGPCKLQLSSWPTPQSHVEGVADITLSRQPNCYQGLWIVKPAKVQIDRCHLYRCAIAGQRRASGTDSVMAVNCPCYSSREAEGSVCSAVWSNCWPTCGGQCITCAHGLVGPVCVCISCD